MTTEERIQALESEVERLEAIVTEGKKTLSLAMALTLFTTAGIELSEDQKSMALQMLGPLENYKKLLEEA